MDFVLELWKSLTPQQKAALAKGVFRVASILKKRLIDEEVYTAEEIAFLESESDKNPEDIGQ